MRLPRVRCNLRLILVAVGVVGMGLGAWVITTRRAAAFGERARYHADEIFGIEDEIFPDPDWEERWLSGDPDGRSSSRSFNPPGWSPPSDADAPPVKAWRMSQARRIAYHGMLRRKYEYAARYPWLPVAPDPPEPQ